MFFVVSTLLSAAVFAQQNIQLNAIQVSPHVYYFQGEAGQASYANQGFMSNAGFVVTSQGILVFDGLATPVLGQAMIEAIRRVSSVPITRLIVSHYHADHFYGAQAFKDLGVEIWGHKNGQIYLNSDAAQARLTQRKQELSPWINAQTKLTAADKWLSFDTSKSLAFQMGEVRCRLIDSSGAHSDEDLMLYVENDATLFAGDLFFSGRIPFVGNADSRVWLLALDQMLAQSAKIIIPGHGAASSNPMQDIQLTRQYLLYLREKMGAAVQELQSFEDAYQQTDWSAFKDYPAFQSANRLNAYGTYLLMEKELLQKEKIK
ncbi:MAG: MBL fold metallo-hydrolase [Undibacterium sp.]|nr:MBL fold metallo-hydrolase [Undibacterium sp.]